MRVLRYGVVGVVNTLIDFGILNLLMRVFEFTTGMGLVLCNIAGFVVASFNSYFMNKKWSFGERSRSSTSQYLVFLLFSVAGVAVNSLILYLLTTVFPRPESFSPVLWVNAAKTCATAASMVWNYLTYHRFVFNEKGRPVRAPL